MQVKFEIFKNFEPLTSFLFSFYLGVFLQDSTQSKSVMALKSPWIQCETFKSSSYDQEVNWSMLPRWLWYIVWNNSQLHQTNVC